MTRLEEGAARSDIREAFELVRYAIRNPKFLRKIRNGAEVRVLRSGAGAGTRPRRLPKKVQVFAAETTFRSL